MSDIEEAISEEGRPNRSAIYDLNADAWVDKPPPPESSEARKRRLEAQAEAERYRRRQEILSESGW